MTPVRRFHSRSVRGFTLVELLVSVGLTGILMWGLLQLYTSATRFSSTMFTEAELVSGGRAILDRMCRELTSAAPLDVGYLRISNRENFDTTAGIFRNWDILQFVAPVGPNGEMEHVCYQILGPDDGAGNYMLYRCTEPYSADDKAIPTVNDQEIPPVSASGYPANTTSELGIKLQSINIQFINYNSNTGTPLDRDPDPEAEEPGRMTWDSTTARLPRAILIELRLADDKGAISIVVSSGAFIGGSGI